MASTTRSLESEVQTEGPERYRKLAMVFGWIAAILVIALLGLIAWIALDTDTTEITAEQQQMIETIDAYIAAWNDGDGAAADALMDPNGYLEDAGGRWYVAENGHSNYLEFLHMTGFNITRGDPVFVNNVVVVPHMYAEDSPIKRPNIYYMYPDGTRIWWVLEPYPIDD
jgi:hypothetical protein